MNPAMVTAQLKQRKIFNGALVTAKSKQSLVQPDLVTAQLKQRKIFTCHSGYLVTAKKTSKNISLFDGVRKPRYFPAKYGE